MTTESVIMMVLLLSSVWGGFIYCVTLAIRKSQDKKRLTGEEMS